MEVLRSDLRYSWRTLRQSPGFAIAAVVALAIGIGANTAIFSVVNTVLLKPLTYPDSDRIVQFQEFIPQGTGNEASIPKFVVWSSRPELFQNVSAYNFDGFATNLTGGAFPEQVKGLSVTHDYFLLFGAALERGRMFTNEEDRPHGPHVVILSDSLWRRRYGSDPAIIGKSIELGGTQHEVVGVVNPSFKFESKPDLWVPFQFDLSTSDQANYFTVAGRLKPGVTLVQANVQMKSLANQFRRRYGPVALQDNESFKVTPLRDSVISDVRTSLLVLLAAVILVLLIACANVANLLLVRASGRRREIAIRAAMGAARSRIIRQLLTESVLLSLLGGVFGLLLGSVGVRALLALSPGNIPRIGENGSAVTLDWHVLAFTCVISLLTGIIFGLLPAIDVSRVDLTSTLKESAGRTGSGFRQNKTRALLVMSEMALSVLLLIGAALLIRTFIALRSVDPGFQAKNILTLQMSTAGERYLKSADLGALARSGIEELQSVPGVQRASSSCCILLEGGFGLPFNIVGRPTKNGPYSGGTGWMSVAPGFFEVYQIPLLKGRTFDINHDGHGSTPVVIINQAFAKQYWPKGDPLKDQLIIGKGVGPEFEEGERQIIGIVGDTHAQGLNNDPRPTAYIPVGQVTDGMTALNSKISPLVWLVRTQGDPHALTSTLTKHLVKASGGLPVANIRTMSEIVVHSTARESFNMLLLSIFAFSALALAAVGVYALMAYSVQQRTQELGIRMALGATAEQVRNLMLLQGLRLTLVGLLAGLVAAFALTRYLASLLFQVKAWDPLVFIIVPVVLAGVALLAVWLPTRRAVTIDPQEALRYE